MIGLATPHIPVSWGELLDKLTILAIKRERIHDPAACRNVAREADLLAEPSATVLRDPAVRGLFERLQCVNAALWEVEDALRHREALADFGPEFIRLARSVYRMNDERAALKRQLNILLQSELIEEKGYLECASQSCLEDAFVEREDAPALAG